MNRFSLFFFLLLLLGSTAAQAAFTDNGDGTVTDSASGLIWDQCSWGQSGNGCASGGASLHTWSQALALAVTANAASYKSHNDWRLPNRSELESLVRIDAYSPAIDSTAFPNTASYVYWTSTTYAPNPAGAWIVDFYVGYSYANYLTYNCHVRLVRSGQSFGSFDSLGDSTPDAFSFAAQTGALLSTAATSGPITVAGINSATAIAIAGGSYAINGGAYTSAAGSVVAGDTVTVRQTSSASFATLSTATLTIGGVSAAFDVTTLAADTTPNAFTFAAQSGVALNALATSGGITVAGIDSAAAIAIVGGSYAINGGAYTSAVGSVVAGDTVTVRQTSSASFATTTSATLTIGGVSAAFDVTTLAADTTPNAFSFTAQSGVPLSTVATSGGITVAGINSAAAIAIVGGSYAINGGAYTSAAGSVSNGQTVSVRQTASASYATTTSATLIIGGVSAAFNVTTLAAPAASTSYSAASATGSGTITASFSGGGAACTYTARQYIPVASVPAPPPAGVVFPHGLFDFTAAACTAGATLSFTVTYPQALPPGTQYWKYGPTPGDPSYHWYVLPATIVGSTVTFTIVDGGLGDDDLSPNGSIVDQGGAGFGGGGALGIPTLSGWGMILLSGLLGLFGLAPMRRRNGGRIG